MAFFRSVKQQFHKENSQQIKQELIWLWGHIKRYIILILAGGALGLAGTLMGLASSVASKAFFASTLLKPAPSAILATNSVLFIINGCLLVYKCVKCKYFVTQIYAKLVYCQSFLGKKYVKA